MFFIDAEDDGFLEAVAALLQPGFVYFAEDDVYRCPAGERLTYRYTSEEEGKTLRCYWTTACQACSQKAK